jgi:hypothetical protein
LDIPPGDTVSLVKTSGIRQVIPGGFTDNPPSVEVVVDRIEPMSFGKANAEWAKAPSTTGRQPVDANDRIVHDSDLQRHKDAPTVPPIHWHFTLARQMLLPLAEDETALQLAGMHDTASRPAHHSLLVTAPTTDPGQQFLRSEFTGLALAASPAGNPLMTPVPARAEPIAPFVVTTADTGVDLVTGGTLAFPTSGSLLLITRYAHVYDPASPSAPGNGPVTVAATLDPHELDRIVPIPIPQHMVKIDNGHLPVFDKLQKCKDLDDIQGRLDQPWGQLIFDYFTALPLEELVRPLAVFSGARLIDSGNYDADYDILFPGYPVIEPSTDHLGASVRGRININSASWWVLDGLPTLPDASPNTLGTTWPATGILTGVPVAEIISPRLDRFTAPLYPTAALTDATERPAARFLDMTIDDINQTTALEPPFVNSANLSPTLARYLVSHREFNRPINDPTYGPIQGSNSLNAPGYVTVGAICDVLWNLPVSDLEYVGTSLPASQTIDQLRRWFDPNPPNSRPFAYLGYLQLVAPIVRLQDWVTVKSHVFTVYATISTTGDPRIDLRTQVTVDRTRCLYSSDLPARIAETEPIAYTNALDD